MSRKIIIPQGTIEDVNQHYVIEIPAHLAKGTGDLIARKKGNKIMAHQLPNWQDDLSCSDQHSSPQSKGTRRNNYAAIFTSTPIVPPQPYGYAQSRVPAPLSGGKVDNVACYNSSLNPTPSGANLEISSTSGVRVRSNIQSNVSMTDSILASAVNRIENDGFQGPGCGCDPGNGGTTLVSYEAEVEEEIVP